MKLRYFAIALGLACSTSIQAAPTDVTVLHSTTEVVVIDTWTKQVDRFNSMHPNINVKLEFLGGEAYKTKLQTLLLSTKKPDIIYSWGGKNYTDRAQAGLFADMTDHLPTLQKQIPASALDAFRVNGRLYGVPSVSKPTMLYYNRDLLAQANVDPKEIETWEGFLGAVKKLKSAGITPLAIGASDGWPAHFYFSYLAMRIGGPEIFKTALTEGFTDPAFLKAAIELKRLADLKPFQKGYMAMGTANAFATFGNGEAAMQLQGEWGYKIQRDNSLSKKGIATDKLGLGRFPSVAGGLGKRTDIISGIDGFAFTNSASVQAAEFMDYWQNEQNLSEIASAAQMMPVNTISAKVINDPVILRAAALVPESTYVHGFVDQILGAHLGGAVNDVSTELVGGTISPEDAIEMLQDAFDFQ
jgi:raffinose/stachyose/melibiose transport system substrate-binding protein